MSAVLAETTRRREFFFTAWTFGHGIPQITKARHFARHGVARVLSDTECAGFKSSHIVSVFASGNYLMEAARDQESYFLGNGSV